MGRVPQDQELQGIACRRTATRPFGAEHFHGETQRWRKRAMCEWKLIEDIFGRVNRHPVDVNLVVEMRRGAAARISH